ncbi:MAG: glycosyltransferase [Planctomycetota bacterium]
MTPAPFRWTSRRTPPTIGNGARGVLVGRLLAQHPALGEHHGTLLPNSSMGPSGITCRTFSPDLKCRAWSEARRTVRETAERSRGALTQVHRRVADTPSLAERLERWVGAPVESLTPGVARAEFEKLAPPRTGHQPIRFGFVGTMDKASGLHLLLDAFEGLEGKAELCLFGSGDDRLYLRTVRARVQEVGARWFGALPNGDPVRAMEHIDVLVVPALWNQPVPQAVREAQAARRPVVIADLPELAAQVRDGQNGLRFEAGSSESLREVMQGFAREADLLRRLELGIQPPRDIAEEAGEWADLYAITLAEHREGMEDEVVPPHLEDLAAQYQDLSRLPTRDLFARVARGLTGLATRMGVELDASKALARAVAAGGHNRDGRVAYLRLERWLEENATALQEGREQVAQESARLDEQRRSLADKARSLQGEARGRDAERLELGGRLEQLEAERDEARAEIRQMEEDFQVERAVWMARQDEWVREGRVLREHVARLATRLLTPIEEGAPQSGPLDGPGALKVADSLHAALKRMQEEMAWRRMEMAKAKSAASGFFSRLIGGEAKAVMKHWDEIPTPLREEPAVAEEGAPRAFRTMEPESNPSNAIEHTQEEMESRL